MNGLGLGGLAQEACDLMPCAKEKQADAGGGEAGDFGDFAMGVTLGMGQPKELALSGFHKSQGRGEDGLRVVLG